MLSEYIRFLWPVFAVSALLIFLIVYNRRRKAILETNTESLKVRSGKEHEWKNLKKIHYINVRDGGPNAIKEINHTIVFRFTTGSATVSYRMPLYAELSARALLLNVPKSETLTAGYMRHKKV